MLDLKYIPSKRINFSLQAGIHYISDLNKTLRYFSPNNVKVGITIEDIRLKCNIKINVILIFPGKSFFYTILGFTESHSGSLNDLGKGDIQITPGSYEN